MEGYGASVLERLGQFVRDRGGPAHSACVLSPFFDESSDKVYPATTELLGALTDRGSRYVEFMIPAETPPDGQTRLRAPRSLVEPGRKSAEFTVYPVTEGVDKEARPLHAKSVWLWNDRWHVYMIGSSNFTGAGLGLARGAPNVEANLAYIFPEDRQMVRLMEQTLPLLGDEIKDISVVSWAPISESDGEEQTGQAVLPAGFEEALFEPDGIQGTLTLHLGRTLPLRWILTYRSDTDEIYSDERHRQTNSPTVAALSWARLGIPNALTVRWWDAQDQPQTAQWPVNVTDPGRLPPPEGLRELTLETLIEILGSRLPLHEAVTRLGPRPAVERGADVPTEIDPHKRIRTETFLLQRTRRVAKAIERLVENLNRPVVHEGALLWRLRGPVGPLALAKALATEARSAGEACFLLAEVALALRRLDVAKIALGVGEETVRRELTSVRTEVEQMARERLQGVGMPPGMAVYVSKALDGRSAMTFAIPFATESITLSTDRVSTEDAERQERTANEILRRLAEQPGVILADEVGMGKTFVALAVAASVALARRDDGPVVVMVPPSLKHKWPRDWDVFREHCLRGEAQETPQGCQRRFGRSLPTSARRPAGAPKSDHLPDPRGAQPITDGRVGEARADQTSLGAPGEHGACSPGSAKIRRLIAQMPVGGPSRS